MYRPILSVLLVAALSVSAAAQIVATPKNQPAPAATAAAGAAAKSSVSADAAKLSEVIGHALQFLGRAENYTLRVESRWKASGDAPGQEGQSNYRLIARGPQHRIEVQSAAAEAPQLVCVNDGQEVTTLLTAQGLYSKHAVGSPQASLESNQMLAQSLAGSAIDILLQPNVGQYVQSQASAIKYRGLAEIGRQKCHHFGLGWAGADVELWLAAEGDPLLVQFVRTACVPTSENECYEMVHTARFQWQLNTKLAGDTFRLSLPKDARRVSDIYDSLSGEDPTARIGKPLPQIQLSQLDGSTLDLAVPEGKRGLVLIFWATWCTPSVEDMPAVSQFVKAGKEQGFAFYAVNVGEEPGAVRRFTAKSPLTSAIALDPKARASSALRITELPAAVVVGPDNTVRAIVTGSAKTVQTEVSKHLAAMLAEPAATPRTARQGNASGAK
jgi:thiol-disulfide isomerase/thioredoxin